MKLALLVLCLLSPAALACDTSHLPLSGAISVRTCSPTQDSVDCVYSGQALSEYMEAIPDNDSLYSIGLHASPWRMYDAEMRVLTVDDVADVVRPRLDGKLEGVELIASWTGVSPEPGAPSL